MQLEIGFALADCRKVWDSLGGMIRALKESVNEEVETSGFLFALIHAALGHLLFLFMLIALAFVFSLVVLAQVSSELKRFLPAPISQQRFQPTNEISPPL